MKVKQNDLSKEHLSSLRSQIDAACHPGFEGRICGAHCKIICDSCGSTKCQCMCSHDCENLTCMLSSEPDEYPIEKGIAPLVFELRRTGFYIPCWSCEGHLGPGGKLWKLPQVWFYCGSTIHLRLLADLLKKMEFHQEVSVAWAVMITHSDAGNPETTYTLRPYLGACDGGEAPALNSLQSDAVAIALALPEKLAAEARGLKAEAVK